MTPPDTVAIAAHLHVLLRRKTGRVTDVEWMACNAEYATEVVRYARTRAAEDGHAELLPWADKLAQAMAALAPPRRPAAPVAPPMAPAASPGLANEADTRYVGRLR